MKSEVNCTQPLPQGVLLDDLEEPVMPSVSEPNVVAANVGLVIASVVLVVAIAPVHGSMEE
ncbi:MAG: hypothetical protein F6K26_03265 [Moorea sp. SIO2I5]|nr:hypothetical protein [Moorena sp. SIO2I5]